MILTRFRFAIAKVLVLLAALLIAWAMNGCMTFEKAQRKYAQTVHDTISVPVSVTVAVPAEAASTVIPTAMTPIVKSFRQGRAHGTITRSPESTTVDCQCDSVSIAKDAIAKAHVEKTVWGVDPKYKILSEEQHVTIEEQQTRFRYLAGAVLIYLLIVQFLKKFDITPKAKNDEATQH